jgi:uncharacterized protein
MTKFAPKTEYSVDEGLCLLPINFERLDGGRVLVTNLVGDYAIIDNVRLQRLVNLEFNGAPEFLNFALSRNFVARRGAVGRHQLIAARLRSRMAFLREPTSLHIFVVTLRCEHSCPYCQVSRRSEGNNRYDMDWETAAKALDIVFQSPAETLKIEFQGGEPLLNVELIEKIVEEAERENKKHRRKIEYVIATNLALLDDRILALARRYGIQFSTSLDGPHDLHNSNRPRPGRDSHRLAVDGIKRIQTELGRDRVSALMTTTQASLERPEAIIDEYLANDLDGIFLRPLSPYGFAVKTKWIEGYRPTKWLQFYERGLRHVLEINLRGNRFVEYLASLIVQRITIDRPTGYVDLRSPAGIGLGALVYNYDGTVYASDEGRMLAEMGDRTFQLGRIAESTYQSLINAPTLVEALAESLTQTSPMCTKCAFEPYCGADPVYHHATQGDFKGVKPLSSFCQRQKGVFGIVFRLIEERPEFERVMRSWVYQ